MSVNTYYVARWGDTDIFTDTAVHTVPVSATTTKTVNGLGTVFLRLDGTGNTGTGPWTTDDVMTASYFVATSAGTASVFPVATVSTTLNVVSAATFQVDATSLDCAVAANFTAKIAGTGGGEINTLTVGTPPSGSEVLRCASARMGPTALTDSLSVAGATTLAATVVGGALACSSTLAVTGTSAFTGAVALNGGATVPTGKTVTFDAGSTLTVSGTFTVTTLLPSTMTVAGASGGSEVLRTTTFRATGASVFTNTVTMSSTLAVTSNITSSGVVTGASVVAAAAGGLVNYGIANLFTLPSSGDAGAGTALDMDAIESPNSHQFNPGGARSITTATGGTDGVYLFVNISAYAITFADAIVAYPSGAFVMAADSTALVYWDKTALMFTILSATS